MSRHFATLILSGRKNPVVVSAGVDVYMYVVIMTVSAYFAPL